MTSNFILDIYKYFAKFPLLEGVQKNFTKKKSGFAEYDIFREQIDTLPEHSIVPEITDLMVGVNDESVNQRIKTVKNNFLFVDYGNGLINELQSEVFESTLMLSVGVAQPFSERKYDFVEESIIMSMSLKLLLDVLKIMQQDNAETCSFRKYITFPVELTPLEPSKFYECAGWAALFNFQDNSLMA